MSWFNRTGQSIAVQVKKDCGGMKGRAKVKKESYDSILKWDESQHPRGPDGHFIESGESPTAAGEKEYADAVAGKRDAWVPGGGGKELPAVDKMGRRTLRVFNPGTGKHGDYDMDTDIVTPDDDRTNSPDYVRAPGKGYKPSHATSGEFIDYLDNTIIPDSRDSGRGATADDLEVASTYLKTGKLPKGTAWKHVGEYKDYLRKQLIPDLLDSGSTGYAKDFKDAIFHIDRHRRWSRGG